MNAKVLCAIFKRNFVAYFSTPTGYVFICLFVFFSSAAAFWPHEFFASNLANLDQLHRFFPLIMLFFAPAITMGVWADEQRLGTDELVLTIPANDLDVVLGKFLAVVGIYCASLAFSFLSNVLLLNWMGSPDLGLLFANYLGYFFVGLAMLSIGMIASFLTANVTIALVIGVALNGPLVVIGFLSPERKGFGISARFEDFGRGVVSFSSVAYFLFIAVAAIYVCMVLIGRRHWMGGRDGSSMGGHYLGRTLAIIIACIGVIFFLGNHDVRRDLTSAKLNSLSPDTIGLLATLNAQPLKDLATRREKLEKELAAATADTKPADELAKLKQRLEQMNLEKKRLESPVEVEAFLSKKVSDRYATKRLDLISILREMKKLAGGRLTVTIHDMEPFSELAEQASEQYGIEPRQVSVETRGIRSEEQVFLGAVVRSGLKQVVIPFFELGIPTEYELIRSIYTVGLSERKTLGVVRTDANLFGGGFDMQRAMQGLGPLPAQPIVQELRKHYKVVDVDPNMPMVNDPDNPDQEKYDVLLVAQPSSLPTRQLSNLAAAISSGIPTAIFEDPFPAFFGNGVPGTDAPRPAPRSAMPGMPQQRPEPKGKIDQLWNILGVHMERQQSTAAPPANPHGFGSPPGGVATTIVWQNFNPYPELRFSQGVTSEWVFANDSAGGAGFKAYDDKDNISRGMYELLFVFPGALKESGIKSNSLTFTPLVRTSSRSGYIFPGDVRTVPQHKLRELEKSTGKEYTLAARISGTVSREVPADLPAGEIPDPTKPPQMKTVTRKINAVVVTDIDMLHGAFFSMRADPQQTGIKLQFQNVPFVLNIVDSLASDQPLFVEIRKRRQLHGRLTKFQQNLQATVNQEMETAIDTAQTKFDKETESAKEKLEKLLKDANEKYAKKQESGTMTAAEEKAIVDELKLLIQTAQDREAIQKVSLTQELSRTKGKIDAQRKRQTYRLNDYYKAVAGLGPPLPPLIVALFVLFYRRSREQEGVASSRLR